jgi:hypothetical protein
MGLFVDRVRFDGEPPNEEVIRRELLERTGSSYGLDSIVRHPHEVVVNTMLDPVTRPYVLKILVEKGGVLLSFATGEPLDQRLPSYVETPWRSLPLWRRAWIFTLFNLGLLATALPPGRRDAGR